MWRDPVWSTRSLILAMFFASCVGALGVTAYFAWDAQTQPPCFEIPTLRSSPHDWARPNGVKP